MSTLSDPSKRSTNSSTYTSGKDTSIRVKFPEGTSLVDAVTAAKAKAISSGVSYVKFRFKNVWVSIGPNAHMDYVIHAFAKYSKNARANKSYVVSK